eukprot:TRINITY_DN25894_c0_g1_i1.p1 TRINITY_DN25894_c0_g1~~TRINITY_DN25894_c0_g1_i1.p1  ORF type:complete len:390 (+),score=37.40 TRINITY_DN25894_c0_g1_i1:51-1220(+)
MQQLCGPWGYSSQPFKGLDKARLRFRESCLHSNLQARSPWHPHKLNQVDHRFHIASRRCRVHSSESKAGKILRSRNIYSATCLACALRAVTQRLRGLFRHLSWLAITFAGFWIFPILTTGLASCLASHSASQEVMISNVLMFVFMPVICVLWAILMATTIDRLWARLQELEQLLVQEATVFSEFVPALLSACGALSSGSSAEVMRLAENYRIYMKRLLNGREEATFQPLTLDLLSQAEKEDPLVRFWALREAVSRNAVEQGVSMRHVEEQLAKLTELRSRRALVQFQTVPKRVLMILNFLSFLILGCLCVASVETSGRVVAIHSLRLRLMFTSTCCFFAVLRELVDDLGNPVSGNFCVSAANRIGRRILVRPGRMLREAMLQHADTGAT